MDKPTHLHDLRANAPRSLLRVRSDARGGVRGGRDEREGQLARELVGHADDAHVRDGGVAEQQPFKLRGRDLEPAHLDELLDAVDDEDLLALVEVDFVARAYPAVLEGLRRAVWEEGRRCVSG